MRRPITILMLVPLLTACSVVPLEPAAESSPSAAPAIAARPTVTPSPAPTSRPAPTAQLTPTSVVTASAVPSPTAAPAPTPPPPAVVPAQSREVVWNRLRFSYDPARYEFLELRSIDWGAWAAALIRETPDPCLQAYPGSDCAPDYVRLNLYDNEGLDLWSWLEQRSPDQFWWPGEALTFDTVVAGRPAVAWSGDGIHTDEMTYVVPLGMDILVINGDREQRFLSGVQFDPGRDRVPAVGQLMMTWPMRDHELWTAPAGGVRVAERPRLYGGSFVTIMAIEPSATQVRTADGVVGWVQAQTHAVVSPVVSVSDAQTRFSGNSGQAHVVHRSPIPLRDSPRSTAQSLGRPIEPNQELQVNAVRGDWVYVRLMVDGQERRGWMRWYYDGAIYIDRVPG